MTKEQEEIARLSWTIEEYKKYDSKQKTYIKRLKDKIAELELTIKSYEASFEVEEELDDVDVYKTKIENLKKEIKTLNRKLVILNNSSLDDINEDTLKELASLINKNNSIKTTIKQLKRDFKHLKDIVYTFNTALYNTTLESKIDSSINKLNELNEKVCV